MDSIEHYLSDALAAEAGDRADLTRVAQSAPDHATAVANVGRVFPEWRLGQVHMNVLRVTRLDLYVEVAGTEHDCFYDDSRLPHLLAWLATRSE